MKNLYKTLIVDDDDTCVFLAKMMLEAAGISNKVYTAENGKQALEIIERSCLTDSPGENASCPQLILLDINMPVMNGFEFLDALQQRWGLNPDMIKVFLLTSSVNPKDVEKAKQYSIAGYLEKPLTVEKLRNLKL